MTLYEMLERLGVADLIDESAATEAQSARLDAEVEVHYQRSYPMRDRLENARMMAGKVTLAAGGVSGGEYGSEAAWEPTDPEDDGDEC